MHQLVVCDWHVLCCDALCTESRVIVAIVESRSDSFDPPSSIESAESVPKETEGYLVMGSP